MQPEMVPGPPHPCPIFMIRGFLSLEIGVCPLSQKNTFQEATGPQCVKGPEQPPSTASCPPFSARLARDGSRRSALPSGAMLRAAG